MREPRPGDRYLLCSDGLSGFVSEETMAEALRDPDPQNACDRLVELALGVGGPDNISCIVADLVETDAPPPEQEPIIGGAAADAPEAPLASDSAAARAADVMVDDQDEDEDGYDGPDESHTARWVLGVVIAVLVLLIAGAVGSWLYIRDQYYLATAGDPAYVSVYRGVHGSFLGFDLSSVDVQTNIPVSALPDDDQARLADRIQASDRDDALRIVATLRTDACDAATATTSTQRHHKKGRQHTPAPPPYCSGSSAK